jgi:hypothetical protein
MVRKRFLNSCGTVLEQLWNSSGTVLERFWNSFATVKRTSHGLGTLNNKMLT